MAFNKNKFCQELISNNVKLFENKNKEIDGGDLICEFILHQKKLNIINNPKIICDYIKDQYFKNVLAIKYKGQYLYKMLFAKHNKMLWDYLFDETKMLFFVYRLLQKNTTPIIHKIIQPHCEFNKLMKNIQQYFYQTAPNTEIGDYLNMLKNNEDNSCVWKKYYNVVNSQKKWIKKRKWNNKIEDGGNNWIKDFNHTFKNFNYIQLWGIFGNSQLEQKGTHFDYLFNLKKNCLVWDCKKDDFRKERINDLLVKVAYEKIGNLALRSQETLDGCFDYIKKHLGNHFLYNIAKNNMERWWRDYNKCWLSKGKCSECNCDIKFKCSTEGEAKELEGKLGNCSKCHNNLMEQFYKKSGQPLNDVCDSDSDSDSVFNDSDSD